MPYIISSWPVSRARKRPAAAIPIRMCPKYHLVEKVVVKLPTMPAADEAAAIFWLPWRFDLLGR